MNVLPVGIAYALFPCTLSPQEILLYMPTSQI